MKKGNLKNFLEGNKLSWGKLVIKGEIIWNELEGSRSQMWRASPSFSVNFTSTVAPCQSISHEQYIEWWIESSFLLIVGKIFDVSLFINKWIFSASRRGSRFVFTKNWYNLGYKILFLLNFRSVIKNVWTSDFGLKV